MATDDQPTFEERKWADELALRRAELDLRHQEMARSNWRSPLFVAVAAAALAAMGNGIITWIDGVQQRELEASRASLQLALEARRSDSARILQVMESGDPTAVRNNLKFLSEAGLISDETLRQQLMAYLDATPDAEIPLLRQLGDIVAAPTRRLQVLSIGISSYDNVADLENPVRDALAVAAATETQRGTIYNDVEVTIATDIDKDGLISQLRLLNWSVKPNQGDVALIYFAGHAHQVDGVFYLAPSDIDATSEATGEATGLSIVELATLLEPLAAGSAVILAIDACPGSDHASPEEALGEMQLNVLLAAVPGTTCFDGQGQNSPFATALVDGMTDASDADGNGLITMSELVTFVSAHTGQLTDQLQVPFTSVDFDGVIFQAVAKADTK